MAFDIDDIVDNALGLPTKPKPKKPAKQFPFEDPMKELPRLGVQPQANLPMSIVEPRKSTDITMEEMEANSKLSAQKLRRDMMTHMPTQRDPMYGFDRTNEEFLIDLAFGGDTRKAKQALQHGENPINQMTGEFKPVLDEPIETAFYGTDLLMGGGVLKGLGGYGKGVAKLAGSPEKLSGALKKYSGGAIDIEPNMYAAPVRKDLKKSIDDAFDEDLPAMLRPQSGAGADNLGDLPEGYEPSFMKKDAFVPDDITPEELNPVITKQAGKFYEIETNAPRGRLGELQAQARANIGGSGSGEGAGLGVQAGKTAEREGVLPRQAVGTQIIPDEQNFAKQIGQEYQRTVGLPVTELDAGDVVSSLERQAPIASAFEQMPRFSDVSPQALAKKQAVFQTYVDDMPEIWSETQAKTYDQLIMDAYAAAAKQTKEQFMALPVKMRFHKHDEGNYQNSDMLRDDIRNNNSMNVYQGGDPHEFWDEIDPATGLTVNEMFRAVHDYFGHAVTNNEFGRIGEERAQVVHGQMFSPLAKLALASETRGQNSWVNYSNANLPMRQKQKELREAINRAKRSNPEDVPALEKQLADTWKDFQFAEQKAVLLPAQMVRPDFNGIAPQSVLDTYGVEGKAVQGRHYSTQKDIDTLDPAKYGTGSAGKERSYAENLPDEMKPVHFYTPEGSPEAQVVAKAKSMTEAPLKGLYDLREDPRGFRDLAKEYSNANNEEIQSNLYRQIHGAGYKGFVGDSGTAVAFGETPVKKVADLEGLTPKEKMLAQPISNDEVMQPAVVNVKPKAPPARAMKGKRMSRQEAEELGYWHDIGDGKKLKKPVSQFQFETIHAHDEVPKRIITPEDIAGGIIIPAGGDRTNSGRLLTQVGGHKFKTPIHLEGGNGFMKDNPDGIWASKDSVTTRLNNMAKPFIDQGTDAFMVYLPMKHKSANFSTMMSDALYEQIVAGDVSKTAMTAFDRKLRKLRPEWKGLNSDIAIEQLHGNGDLRHAFSQIANLEYFQKRGFPDLAETRYAITDPDLLDTPLHHGGQAIGKMDGTVISNPSRPHTTYNTTMGGEYAGGFTEAIPREILFPTFHAERRAQGKPASRDYRAFSMSDQSFQKTDQEWLDGIMNYLERKKLER